MFTADPRLDEEASLIEEIAAVDEALESVAGRSGSSRGSGGMASKLAAAKIASWSGVRAVIAAANQPGVVMDALDGEAGRHGGAAAPRTAAEPQALDRVRDRRRRPGRGRRRRAGARSVSQGRSLLAAGVRAVEGDFDAAAAVEVVGADGRPFAKGLVQYSAARLRAVGRAADG